MDKQFVHLNVHSEYAIVDSTIRIPQLIEKVKALGMPAVAITDMNNVFATIKFFNAAKKAGIKPIIGADVWVTDPNDPELVFELTLLCQNRAGYLNLSQIISHAQYHRNNHHQPCVDSDYIFQHNEGLIVLADSMFSDVGRLIASQKLDEAVSCMLQWQQVFADRYYLALADIDREHEASFNAAVMYMASHQGIPMVATGRCRFLEADDFNAHEARICINRGYVLADTKRPKEYTGEQYIKSSKEMVEAFTEYPSLIDNSYAIAQRCNLDFNFKDYYLPDFPVPDGQTIDSYFALLCRDNLNQFLASNGPDPDYTEADYHDRLDHEIKVILDMGFPGYFLIVSDFIKWSKDNQIPVGPGRGSGAGSLVAYVLHITDLDPLKYELLFERFLNPERISMPDFDVDFCMDRRDEVIAYVADKYGKEKVSQIITYGSMNAKAVIRDAGRVLGYPYPVVDGIAKLIPNDLGITLTESLKKAPEMALLYEEDEEAQEVIDLSLKLEGLKRNVGKHAGGVVIAPSAISDFCPVYVEENSQSVVSQFDKDDVESIGLVKFDFLGLRTLTIIDWALQSIEKETGNKLDIADIPLDDKKTFALLRSAKTTSVFQLESSGMQALIGRLRPDSFEDIIALVALYRPGPLDSGMVDTYVKCKHGMETPNYMHDSLKEILEPTYGVILYQEQVMQIAQVLSGYTLGGADILRKAMGKKIASVMEEQKQIFIDGAVERDVDAQLAADIFAQIETFAGYGFNKSHSAAYALVSYQTAYLKAHYPVHFMAAVLSADMDNTDKVVNQLFDIRGFKIAVKPPYVNESVYKFKAKDGAIIYGLGAIKGVGEGAIEEIITAREQNGSFESFQDLCTRVNLRKVNKRTLEALIRAGAFDQLHDNRRQLLDGMERVVKAADQMSKDRDAGQFDLFGNAAGNSSYQSIKLPLVKEDERLERLLAEKTVTGTFLSDHPLQLASQCLSHVTTFELNKFHEMNITNAPTKDFRVVGLVTGVRPGFKGKMKVRIVDQSGAFEFNLSEAFYYDNQDKLETNAMILIEGTAGMKTFKGRDGKADNEIFISSINNLYSLDEAVALFCDRICFVSSKNSDQLGAHIDELLAKHGKGKAQLYIHYKNQSQKVNLKLSEQFKIRPSYQLIEEALTKPSIQQVLTKN
ncbi:DNA polymerase III subunit alpha [Marinicella sp. S1101]|uniref:DNA polymerase III subunit alpha n=1 Tax=Marinicella marina TaxID=2996016 RepID=UPI002260A632|nr:DNA polymerase III subunit alpha [Marinicella marina]MCX7554819.1 DNA polymerase III subunit alpha [Marinicella marina]MDJ1140948.1 DNA polymerase III subunit alpha [Marinicella marina]